MKYYIIAGEASGDLHGSNLIREIKNSIILQMSAAGAATLWSAPAQKW